MLTYVPKTGKVLSLYNVASENGSVETVRILLQNGADINLSTEN